MQIGGGVKPADRKAEIAAAVKAERARYIPTNSIDKGITMGLDITRRETGYLLGRSLALVEHAHETARRTALGQGEWMWMMAALPKRGWRVITQAFNALPAGHTKERVSAALADLALRVDALPDEAINHGDVALGYYHQRATLRSGKVSPDDTPWTGADLRQWRERCALTQQEAADIVEVGLRQYKRLEEPDGAVDAVVLLRCIEHEHGRTTRRQGDHA